MQCQIGQGIGKCQIITSTKPNECLQIGRQHDIFEAFIHVQVDQVCHSGKVDTQNTLELHM